MPRDTKKLAVLNLLRGKLGDWVTRKEIEEVGGWDFMRRLREVRQQASSLDLIFESRADPTTGLSQYRVVAREAPPKGKVPRWACQACGRIVAQSMTQPSIDSRWRVGPCPVCRTSAAVYEEVTW